MMRFSREALLASGLILVLSGYLYYGTGIHSDDYDFMLIGQGWSLRDWLGLYRISTMYLYCLPTIYFDYAQIVLFGHHLLYYDLVKAAVSCFAVFSAWLFARQYMESRRALLFALLFILYPLHDATNYWTIGTYMVMTGAWIMLSHALLSQERTVVGVAAGFVGAFWSYASPPLVGGLSVTFLMKREFRKFFLFILPEALYVVYYAGVSKLTAAGNFHPLTSPLGIVKQFALQVGSFLDAAIGPSFWLKVYFSILSLGLLSLLAGSLLALFFWRLYPQRHEPVNRQMLLACVAVAFCAFLVYSLTGLYPQIAFNLGDRVTYYGCMLLAFLLVALPWPRRVAVVLLTVISLSITGLSDHWREWSSTQTGIVEAIRSNEELKNYGGDILFVSGYQYSQLGALSHIELFTMPDVVEGVFAYATGKRPAYRLAVLSKRHYYENGEVIDRKFGGRIPAGGQLVVYDAEQNQLRRIPAGEINAYIAALPGETRHWVQLLPDGMLRRGILYLMPRLQYAFG